jgi:hypothetical protein
VAERLPNPAKMVARSPLPSRLGGGMLAAAGDRGCILVEVSVLDRLGDSIRRNN